MPAYNISASDVSSDKSFKVLHQKLQNFTESASDFIKTASIDYDELHGLPESAFAWPEFRKYAMHNKEHAALSLVYAQGEKLPKDVTDRLEKAAALYGIDLKEKPAEPITKTAAEVNTSEYLLPEQNMCKVASANDVQLGIEFLTRNKKYLGVEKTAHANKVLCQKAHEFGVSIPKHLYQSAGLTECNLEKMAEWVETRAMLTKGAHSESFTKLAKAISENKESTSRETLLKVASTIATLDQAAGLTKEYYTKLPDPMMTVFNTEKLAEESLYFGGQNIPFSKFLQTDSDIYAQVLGDDIVDEISTDGSIDAVKLRDVLVTLPADLQVALAPFVLQS